MAIPAEIQDLLDPREALHIELRKWVALTEAVGSAKIALQLCAPAAHAGHENKYPYTRRPDDTRAFDDYNPVHPHSALGYRSPQEF